MAVATEGSKLPDPRDQRIKTLQARLAEANHRGDLFAELLVHRDEAFIETVAETTGVHQRCHVCGQYVDDVGHLFCENPRRSLVQAEAAVLFDSLGIPETNVVRPKADWQFLILEEARRKLSEISNDLAEVM